MVEGEKEKYERVWMAMRRPSLEGPLFGLVVWPFPGPFPLAREGEGVVCGRVEGHVTEGKGGDVEIQKYTGLFPPPSPRLSPRSPPRN